MSFGQQSGPPASRQQLQELTELLQAAGHTDFRDARGPLGFTQRQAGGKFTRDEAAGYIEQLILEAEQSAASGEIADTVASELARFPTAALAAELQRRGWVVLEP